MERQRLDGIPFPRDEHGFALRRIKGEMVETHPVLYSINIRLQLVKVLLRFYNLIEKHVVCKEIEGTPFREASGSYVINIDEEKEGTEDGTLWHSRNYSCFGGCSTINYNMLPPVC